MAPTRKYMDHASTSKPVPILGVLIGLLLIAAALGALVWINIEVWTAIFG